MFTNVVEDDPMASDDHYVLDGKSLREKLLDIVGQQEEHVRKVGSPCFLVEAANFKSVNENYSRQHNACLFRMHMLTETREPKN